MTPVIRSKLIKMIERHEGFEPHVYTDSVGKLSIGFGRNLSDVGISLDEGGYLLINDVQVAEMEAWKHFPGYSVLDDVRKAVIVEMAYNLGIGPLLGFHDMVSALARFDFKAAGEAMLASKWHAQVGKRVEELAMIMETGNL